MAIISLAAVLLIWRTAAAEPGPAPERTLVDADPAEVECLALNIYFEGRGEPDQGQVAVAQVTLNRVADPAWPNTVCAVVKQGGPRGPCQFSWYCDGLPDRPTDRAAWRRAQNLAREILSGERPDPTNGALYFHVTTLNPAWARKKESPLVIGQHIFFRL